MGCFSSKELRDAGGEPSEASWAATKHSGGKVAAGMPLPSAGSSVQQSSFSGPLTRTEINSRITGSSEAQVFEVPSKEGPFTLRYAHSASQGSFLGQPTSSRPPSAARRGARPEACAMAEWRGAARLGSMSEPACRRAGAARLAQRPLRLCPAKFGQFVPRAALGWRAFSGRWHGASARARAVDVAECGLV